MVADVLGLGFEIRLQRRLQSNVSTQRFNATHGPSLRPAAVAGAGPDKKAVEMTPSHGFFHFLHDRHTPLRVAASSEDQKSGLAGCDGWLGVCTKGSSSHVQAVVAG
jgi:hypothetical protein